MPKINYDQSSNLFKEKGGKPHTVVAMADPESLNRFISEAVSRAVSETARSVFAQIGIQTKLYSLW